MQLLCYPWIEIAFSPEQRDERLNGGVEKENSRHDDVDENRWNCGKKFRVSSN